MDPTEEIIKQDSYLHNHSAAKKEIKAAHTEHKSFTSAANTKVVGEQVNNGSHNRFDLRVGGNFAYFHSYLCVCLLLADNLVQLLCKFRSASYLGFGY